jgi:hypothetical protein
MSASVWGPATIRGFALEIVPFAANECGGRLIRQFPAGCARFTAAM